MSEDTVATDDIIVVRLQNALDLRNEKRVVVRLQNALDLRNSRIKVVRWQNALDLRSKRKKSSRTLADERRSQTRSGLYAHDKIQRPYGRNTQVAYADWMYNDMAELKSDLQNKSQDKVYSRSFGTKIWTWDGYRCSKDTKDMHAEQGGPPKWKVECPVVHENKKPISNHNPPALVRNRLSPFALPFTSTKH